MDRPNLTVLTDALVTRILFDGKRRATGLEVALAGKLVTFHAGQEVVMAMGAIQTPKVLMQSGVGDAAQLRKYSIDVVQHLPGVGANLQEHVLLGGCIGEYADPKQFQGSGPEATLVRPQSRGQVRITGPDPLAPIDVDTGLLSHPADVEALTECVRLCRAIGNSTALSEFRSRELAPIGQLSKAELTQFIRNAAVPYWHYTGTAKMGRDEMSVVDGRLKVYGLEGLRIADGSIMPNIASSNTMAPCVIIGERASEIVRRTHHL
jgi:choline dehydrogenase